MLPLISDARFNSIALVIIAVVGIVPLTLTAYYSRGAKKNSQAAADSAHAAAKEVLTNGGMSDPNPNLNDHVKYQTEMLERLQGLPERMDKLEGEFQEHIQYAAYMGRGMAEMYLEVMGKEPPQQPPSDKVN